MSNFCGNCGLGLEGRSECRRCGHVVVPVHLSSPGEQTGHAVLPGVPRPVLVASRSAAEVRAEREIENGDTRARVRPATTTASTVTPGAPAPSAPQSSAPLGQPVPGVPPVLVPRPYAPNSTGQPTLRPVDPRPAPQSPASQSPASQPGNPQQPGSPQSYGGPQAGGPQQYGVPRPAAVRQRPPRAVARVNPLRRLPAGDLWRDLAAIACLVGSLLLPWDRAHDGTDLWWAWAALAAAGVGVLVPYVMISRLFWRMRPSHSVVLKTLLAIPVVVAAVAVLVRDLMTISGSAQVGGTGIGVALALAGAFLVVQPRAADEVLGPQREGLWANGAHVVALTTVGLQILAVVVHVGRGAGVDAFSHDDFTTWLQLVVVALALPLVLLGVPAVQHAMGRTAGRRVFALAAWTALAVTALAGLEVPGFASLRTMEAWDSLTGGTFLLGAAASLAVARAAVRRTGAGVDPATGWLQTARLSLALAGAGATASLAVSISALTEFNTAPASGVASAVLVALVALTSICASLMLVDLRRRVASAVLAFGVLALGVAAWVVGTNGDFAVVAAAGISPWEATCLVVLPLSAGLVLTVPGSVRATGVRPPKVAWGPPGPVPVPPLTPVAAPPAPPGAVALSQTQRRAMTYVQSVPRSQQRPAGATQSRVAGAQWSGWGAVSAR